MDRPGFARDVTECGGGAAQQLQDLLPRAPQSTLDKAGLGGAGEP
jgi:hypothetical protein